MSRELTNGVLSVIPDGVSFHSIGQGDNVMGILSRLFGSGSDDRERANEKHQKFQELERLYAGDTEMINNAKALWLTSRGNHYGERGYFDHAIVDFKEAITLKPDHIPAFLGLGVAYKYKEMFEKRSRYSRVLPENGNFTTKNTTPTPK